MQTNFYYLHKYTSLLHNRINYERKRFYDTGLRELQYVVSDFTVKNVCRTIG
jgi:hypothetical protein